MRNYWVRLFVKIVIVLLFLIALVYLFESKFPGKIEWSRLFDLINSMIAAWGNILIALGILAYVGYWRDRATRKLEVQMKEVQKQGLEIKEAVLATVQKTNRLLDTLGDVAQEVHRFLESGEWKEKAKAALGYVEEQLQHVAGELDILRDRLRQEIVIAVPDTLEVEIDQMAGEDSFRIQNLSALLQRSSVDEEVRSKMLRVLEVVDQRAEEIIRKFQAALHLQLSKIFGFAPDSLQVEEMKKLLRLERVYARAKIWLLLALIRKRSGEGSFRESLKQIDFQGMLLEVAKKYLSQAGMSLAESMLVKKLPAPEKEKGNAGPLEK